MQRDYIIHSSMFILYHLTFILYLDFFKVMIIIFICEGWFLMNLYKKSGISKKTYYSEVMSLAVPAFSEKLLLTLVGLISSVILGRVTGSEAMSAASAATTITDILQALYLGFGFGASILIAREAGRENPKKRINEITLNSIYLNAAMGLIFGTVCLIFSESVLKLLFSKKAENVILLATDYLKTVLPISFIAAVDASVSSCLRGAHDAKTPFIITAGVNVLNAVLCIVFIGFMDMGIKGAAVSYVISTVAGCLFRLLFLKMKRSPIHIESFHKPDFFMMKRIANASISSASQSFLTNLAFLGMQAVTSLIGTAALAGYQIANNIIKLTYCITYGFESAQATLVGNNLGRKNPDGARLYAYGLLRTAEIFCLVWAVIMFVFAKPLCLLFINQSETETLSRAVVILRVLCFSVPITTYFQGCQGALKSGGETAAIIISTVLGPWVIKVPLSYFLVKAIVDGRLFAFLGPLFSGTALYPLAKTVLTDGVTGMMVGFFVDYTARSIVYAVRLHKERWLTARL